MVLHCWKKPEGAATSIIMTNTVTVKFFAHIREQVGMNETLVPVKENSTIDDVRRHLCDQGEPFATALTSKIVMSCNQTMVRPTAPVKAGDEIAFFPPVTGG